VPANLFYFEASLIRFRMHRSATLSSFNDTKVQPFYAQGKYIYRFYWISHPEAVFLNCLIISQFWLKKAVFSGFGRAAYAAYCRFFCENSLSGALGFGKKAAALQAYFKKFARK
jgi:hypothetical protein